MSPKQERGSGGDDQDDDLNPELTEDDEGLIDNGERSFVSLKKGKVGLEDFKLLKLIGKGGFGKVPNYTTSTTTLHYTTLHYTTLHTTYP